MWTWIQILALPPAGFGVLVFLFNLSESHFPLPLNGSIISGLQGMCEDSEERCFYRHPNAHIRVRQQSWKHDTKILGVLTPDCHPEYWWPGVAWWLWPCGAMIVAPAVRGWYIALDTGISTRIQSQRGGKSRMLQGNGEDLFWTDMRYCLQALKVRGFCRERILEGARAKEVLFSVAAVTPL